jgi:hypothetical protein
MKKIVLSQSFRRQWEQKPKKKFWVRFDLSLATFWGYFDIFMHIAVMGWLVPFRCSRKNGLKYRAANVLFNGCQARCGYRDIFKCAIGIRTICH